MLRHVLAGPGLMLGCAWATALADPAADMADWGRSQLWQGFVDGSFSAAAMSIANPRRILFADAIGYADVSSGEWADGKRSRFRLSSISKLFTAIAVAQLLERGRIGSLQDPVNRYLRRWSLPANGGREVTIHHLLTHSAGFDYSRFGLWGGEAGAMPRPGAGQLAEHRPPYVRPAGAWAVYSNFGGALLGVMVEDIVGQPLHRYLAEQVFTPLGMTETGLAEAGTAVRPYLHYPDGALREQSVRPYSRLMSLSMGLESSARDMGRFLSMLLNGGSLGGSRVLKPPSVDLLFAQRFSNHPAANGFGMLFDVVRQNGSTFLYMHNGSTPGFSSHLVVCPQRGLGFFSAVAGGRLSFDGERSKATAPAGDLSAPRLAAEFVRRFIAPYHFVPAVGPRGRVAELAGVYLTDKRPLATPEALFDLFYPPSRIDVEAADGHYFSNGRPAVEVGGDVYMQEGPWAYREMYRFENGKPVMTLYGSEILRRVSPWLVPEAKRGALQWLSIALLLATWTLFLPVRTSGQHSLRIAQLLLWPLVACFPLYVYLQERGVDSLMLQVQQGDRSSLFFAAALANGLALVAAWLILSSVRAWRRGWWGRGGAGVLLRCQLSAQAAAALALVWLLWTLNLVGP